MAHEITIRENNKAEFAFTGSRQKIWHGLGQELTQDATIEQWKTESGMDWEIFPSAVMYQSFEGQHTFAEKNVLFRSDTKAPLSVVSANYKIVQPGQVLDFFADLCSYNGFKLSAAGTLFGGKRFWATAEVGKSTQPVAGDDVSGQLLLVSSADGSTKTEARYVSCRAICSNTLAIALGENSKRMVRKSHKSEFDAREFKIDLGILDEGWDTFSTNLKKLASMEMTDAQALNYFQAKFFNPQVEAEKQTWGAVKTVNQLMGLFNNGTGAEFSRGTAYGALQAVTENFTHGGSTKQDPSRKFFESEMGKKADIKTEVYSDLLAMMA